MKFLFCTFNVSCLFDFIEIFNFNNYFQYEYILNDNMNEYKEEDNLLKDDLFDSCNKCYLCKKYITHTFYMYDDNMFCSVMCRLNKINNDNKKQ